jgi:hypothetical protein
MKVSWTSHRRYEIEREGQARAAEDRRPSVSQSVIVSSDRELEYWLEH